MGGLGKFEKTIENFNVPKNSDMTEFFKYQFRSRNQNITQLYEQLFKSKISQTWVGNCFLDFSLCLNF